MRTHDGSVSLVFFRCFNFQIAVICLEIFGDYCVSEKVNTLFRFLYWVQANYCLCIQPPLVDTESDPSFSGRVRLHLPIWSGRLNNISGEHALNYFGFEKIWAWVLDNTALVLMGAVSRFHINAALCIVDLSQLAV